MIFGGNVHIEDAPVDESSAAVPLQRTKARRARRIPATESPSGLVVGDDAVTDWPTIREWVLQRDEYRCQICKQRPATDADHIWPRKLGGTDHIDNLRAACGPCNKAKGDRVDVAVATEEQLNLGIFELGRRMDEFEAEQMGFLKELLVRALAQESDCGDMALKLRLTKSTLEVRVATLEEIARRLGDCATRISGLHSGR
jgi:hypothetical protein